MNCLIASDRKASAPPPVCGRPLLPIAGVSSLIERTRDQVLALIEEGRLAYAWNLAVEPSRYYRKCLRVLPICVDSFISGQECQLDWQDVLALMIPPGAPTLRAVDICRALNLCEDTPYLFIRRNELQAVTKARRGPKGSALISTESFIKFLERRRYPFPESNNKPIPPRNVARQTA